MSGSPTPPTLDYRGARPPQRNMRWFIIGFSSGVSLSASAYLLGPTLPQSPWIMPVVGLKMLFIMLVLFTEQLPGRLALGMLASIPVGALIFLGICAARFQGLN